MKHLIIFTVIAALSVIVNANEIASYAPVPFSVRDLKPQTGWACKNATGWSCKDCNTMQYCENGFFEYQITCGVQFPGNDYCNPDIGLCSSDRDVCQEIETGMNCPSAGLFPDIVDCRKYVSCTGSGNAGISYNCMFNSIYDHNQKRCKTNALCYNVTADCAGQYKAFPYKSDPRYFVICRGYELPMLKDCGRNLVFNDSKMICEFQCTVEGNFPNPSDPKSYFICVYNGETLARHQALCLDGTYFNETTGNCIYGIS